jgi:hypothetical protein
MSFKCPVLPIVREKYPALLDSKKETNSTGGRENSRYDSLICMKSIQKQLFIDCKNGMLCGLIKEYVELRAESFQETFFKTSLLLCFMGCNSPFQIQTSRDK